MKLRTLAFLLGAMSTAFADSRAELKTVGSVDLNRYVGRWYEIARYPNRFEKDCVSDVTAQYDMRPDGKIEVVNSCRQADGKMKTSKGVRQSCGQADERQTESHLLLAVLRQLLDHRSRSRVPVRRSQ